MCICICNVCVDLVVGVDPHVDVDVYANVVHDHERVCKLVFVCRCICAMYVFKYVYESACVVVFIVIYMCM